MLLSCWHRPSHFSIYNFHLKIVFQPQISTEVQNKLQISKAKIQCSQLNNDYYIVTLFKFHKILNFFHYLQSTTQKRTLKHTGKEKEILKL